MKRIGNLFNQIISIENLKLADIKARRGKYGESRKKTRMEIAKFDEHRDFLIKRLHENLKNHMFMTSPYSTFKVYEPKERIIYRLPYYPDRIVHHAILNILEPIWRKTFTYNTYSCVPGKGIEGCAKRVKKIIRKYKYSKHLYCLKIDIKKFYPSVNHEILKEIIEHKIKDQDVLWLLDDIIDSVEGLPIGNYTSQYLGNLYLCYFMHKINEVYKLDATEYADDIVFFSESKSKLHKIFREFIKPYMEKILELTIKPNWQVFPVAKNRNDKHGRSIDYLGYKFYREEIGLRKSIKINFNKAAKKFLHSNPNPTKKELNITIGPWLGWIKHSNSSYLLKAVIGDELYNKYYRGKI